MTALQLVSDNSGHEMEIATIATSAVLLDYHISTWTGRLRDKKTTQEVTDNKNAGSSKAASVIKNLMSDDKDLDGIKAYAQECRMYVAKHTLRWSDGGTRLLPGGLIFEITSELDAREAEFTSKVAKFVADYPTKVSAAAFKLGQLFNRDEFPSADDIARRFAMSYVLSPVPTAGDFRVDVQNDIGEMLKKRFAKDADARVADMLREPWERAYESLTHIKDRLETALAYVPDGPTDGRRAPKLFQSMIDNALEIVTLLEKLNITKDPQLTELGAKMRRMLSPIDIKSVRESKEVQESVHKQVGDILAAFDFGPMDE